MQLFPVRPPRPCPAGRGVAPGVSALIAVISPTPFGVRLRNLPSAGCVLRWGPGNAHSEIVWLTGTQITESHWDHFWYFYQDTGERKWGTPYLTRQFFSLLGQTMADRLLLIFAMRDGVPIAGALNLIGADALYGRYWGCREDVPFLHFELCFYQAIDFAIQHKLGRVEAGAQGEHKLARGYGPMATWSAHYIADTGFRAAVSDFLVRERDAVDREIAFLEDMTPLRKQVQMTRNRCGE